MKYLFVLSFAIVYEIYASCPNGTFPNVAGDKCYFISNDSKQFILAEISCRNQNGDLASISNAFDNMAVTANAQDLLGSKVTYAWLGGSNANNGTWIWTDGQPFSYTNWAKGNPDNDADDSCLALNLSNGHWYSQNCYNIIPYICELSQTNCQTTTCPPCPQTTCPPCQSQCEISCPDSWVYNSKTGFCYKVFFNHTFISNNDGEPVCEQYNGHLASIHSGDENSFISKNPKNNTYENCMALRLSNGQWYSIDCYITLPYICELSQTTTMITNSSSTTITSITINPTDPKHSNYRNLLIFSCVGIFIFIFTAFMLIYCILRYREKKRRELLDQMALEMQVQSAIKEKPKELKKLDNFWIEEKRLEVKYKEFLGSGFSSNVYVGKLFGTSALASLNSKTTQFQDCKVAIKIANEYGNNESKILETEIELMKKIGYHEHIVPMLGWSMKQNKPCLVLELCERNLLNYVRENHDVQFKHLISILWQIVQGLQYVGPFIGLYYDLTNNAFQWSDNTPVNYTNFYSNNTSTGYCVIQDYENGLWYTQNCSNNYGGFVCKTRPQIWQNNTLEYKIKDTAFLNIIEGNNETNPINSYFGEDKCSNTCPTCMLDSCTPCPTLLICNTKCPDGWTYYSATNFCYKFDNNMFNFSNAEQACQQSNSHLISIHNENENNFLKQFVAYSWPFWIGLSYNISLSNFTWTDNTPFDYITWYPGQPDITSNQYCVLNSGYDFFSFHTYICNATVPFVCKKPPNF